MKYQHHILYVCNIEYKYIVHMRRAPLSMCMNDKFICECGVMRDGDCDVSDDDLVELVG